jgi:trafficking protein particle complex subunit 11
VFTLSCLKEDGSLLDLSVAFEPILKSIHDVVLTYYRDYEKRIRRKRSRLANSPPKTASATRTLSQNGWLVRYDFKLGLVCELRKDMDSAIKYLLLTQVLRQHVQ